jgi:hypothetical protein
MTVLARGASRFWNLLADPGSRLMRAVALCWTLDYLD